MEKETYHFKSPSGNFIYLLIIGIMCPDVKTFGYIFPLAEQITEEEFDQLYDSANSEMKLVGDARDIDAIEELMSE